MTIVVQVWDCRIGTDKPVRVLEFPTWDDAAEYIKNLPPYEGGTIERRKKNESL